MNILNITIQNIKTKPLYTGLSVFILALSIALLLGIQQVQTAFKNKLENNLGKIDLVVGAKGSPLQLVLASVLHVDNPTGNILYKEAKGVEKHPMVKTAIPIAYGDNYKGYRIVGTTPDFNTIYNAVIDKGHIANSTMEVVLGHTVAQQLNLKIGDKLLSSHGLIENDIDVHDDELTVVGILKPTKKVIDRLIVTPLETIWDVHDHGEDQHDNTHDHQHDHVQEVHKDLDQGNYDGKEITSLLVNFKSPRALLNFPKKINKDTNMMAVLPKFELQKLYEFTSVGFKTMTLLAYLILIISCIIIFISLYKMVKERAFDLAILRTYGATHFQLIKMILYEGFILIITAFLLGFMFLKVGLYFSHHFIEVSYKVTLFQSLSLLQILQTGMIVAIVVIVAVVLAMVPIIKMNISTILSNEK